MESSELFGLLSWKAKTFADWFHIHRVLESVSGYNLTTEFLPMKLFTSLYHSHSIQISCLHKESSSEALSYRRKKCKILTFERRKV